MYVILLIFMHMCLCVFYLCSGYHCGLNRSITCVYIVIPPSLYEWNYSANEKFIRTKLQRRIILFMIYAVKVKHTHTHTLWNPQQPKDEIVLCIYWRVPIKFLLAIYHIYIDNYQHIIILENFLTWTIEKKHFSDYMKHIAHPQSIQM